MNLIINSIWKGVLMRILAPYDVLEIKTHLTKEAEDEGYYLIMY